MGVGEGVAWPEAIDSKSRRAGSEGGIGPTPLESF